MNGSAAASRVFKVETVVFIVIAVAGVGLVLGATFGYVAGRIAPSFFQHMLAMPGNPIEVEPLGTATLIGAAGGVVLGGCLGGFAILMSVASQWIAMRRDAEG